MLVPHERHRQEQLAAGAKHAPDLAEKLLRVKHVLEHLKTDDRIEFGVGKWEDFAVIFDVDLTVRMVMPGSRSIEADIAVDGEQLAIGLAATADIEHLSADVGRQLADGVE